MRISGFTFVRNATLLGYPIEASIRSLLPLVDELVVNVPHSGDDTLQRVRELGDPKIVAFESDWDASLREGGLILSLQTNRALDRCTGEWAIYLQADEVLHEEDYSAIRAALSKCRLKPRVDGLSFRFLHFEGGYRHVNPFRYRRQVRAIRNDGSNRSWGDACGFRKADGGRLRLRGVRARVFHYGWARQPDLLFEKNRELEQLYHDDDYIRAKYDGKKKADQLETSVCVPFRGQHPQVMQQLITAAQREPEMPLRHRMPLFLRPAAWRRLLKKWGILK
jgi:glycosyltransferase involved in cell wall biosynthesis